MTWKAFRHRAINFPVELALLMSTADITNRSLSLRVLSRQVATTNQSKLASLLPLRGFSLEDSTILKNYVTLGEALFLHSPRHFNALSLCFPSLPFSLIRPHIWGRDEGSSRAGVVFTVQSSHHNSQIAGT